jgi:hypothetical protein
MTRRAQFGCLSVRPLGLRSLSATFAAIAVLFGFVTTASAATITFDEAAITATMTNTYAAIQGPLTYSDSMAVFSLDGITFVGASEAFGAPFFQFRSTFDNRSPYPYHFITGNVLQTSGDALRIDFATPISAFAFGAALDATSSPSLMDVSLFSHGALLVTTTFNLVGIGANSEGSILLTGLVADSVYLRNRGDGIDLESKRYWVLDNLQTQVAVPEPTSLVLVGTGFIALFQRRSRKVAKELESARC